MLGGGGRGGPPLDTAAGRAQSYARARPEQPPGPAPHEERLRPAGGGRRLPGAGHALLAPRRAQGRGGRVRARAGAVRGVAARLQGGPDRLVDVPQALPGGVEGGGTSGGSPAAGGAGIDAAGDADVRVQGGVPLPPLASQESRHTRDGTRGVAVAPPPCQNRAAQRRAGPVGRGRGPREGEPMTSLDILAEGRGGYLK